MKTRTAYLMISIMAVISVLAVLPVSSAYADETVPNGWNIHAGDGYEVYITPNKQVSASELILVVNYGNDAVTFYQTYDGETVTDITIGAASSSFIQLDFTEDGTYTLYLSRSGIDILTIDKTRTLPIPGVPDPEPPWNDDDWNIVPPGPAPWKPTPTDPSDPLIYSQKTLDSLISKVTFESLTITACLMAVSMVLGAVVQRTVRFIWPTDFVTIGICTVIAAQFLHWPTQLVIPGIDTIWWVPVLIGYVIGYIVIGRTHYTMVRRITDEKSFETLPWVIYHIDGRPYLQPQTNISLIKRLFFGIHHQILTPVALEPDYEDKTKYPGFPRFNRKMVCVESHETYEIMPKTDRRFYLKRYATKVTLAYGSTVSKYELHRNISALEKANQNLIAAENKIYALNQSISVRMADTVAAFLAKVYSRSPGAVFKDAVDRWNTLEDEDNDQKKRKEQKQEA